MCLFIRGKVDFEFTSTVIEALQSYSYCEQYDMVVMDTLLRDPACAHRNRTKQQVEDESDDRYKHSRVKVDTFEQVRDNLSTVGIDGVYKYKISRSTKVPQHGRVYDHSHYLMAYVQNRCRAVALDGMVEIDQQGCHPRIFMQLYTETFGKEPRATKLLVQEKAKFMADALGYYKLPGTEEADALIKKIVLAMTMGGSLGSAFKLNGNKKNEREQAASQVYQAYFKDDSGGWKIMPLLAQYMREIRKVLNVVKERYPEVYEAVKKQDNNEYKNNTRMLSYILQEIETAVSAIAVQYLVDNDLLGDKVDGAYVMSFLHDGFYVKHHEQINDGLLGKLEAHVKDQAGLDVKFGFKRVDPGFTAEETAAIDAARVKVSTEDPETMSKMMNLARLAFPFPEGSVPERLDKETSVLRTNDGYEIAITQRGLGCAQVDIRVCGRLFQSKCLFEVDTVDGDRAARTQLAHRLAHEVFGEDAEVDVQIKHNAGEYIELREKEGEVWVKRDINALFKSGERHTVFIKGSMGGGKSYFVTTKLAGPITQQDGGSSMFLAPNVSLVNSMVADGRRQGVGLTPYNGRPRPPVSRPPKKKARIDRSDKGIRKWFAPRPSPARVEVVCNSSIAPGLSGDVEMPAQALFRDDRALVTTFDSLSKSELRFYDLLFLDELSKNRMQIASGTMDSRPNIRNANFEKLRTYIARSRIVVGADAGMEKEDVKFVRELRMAGGGESETTNIFYHNSHYRLDVRFVNSKHQLRGSILRSAIVEKKNTVIASSTKAGAKDPRADVQKYALGKVDLFMNKVDRYPSAVIAEVMEIHQYTHEEAVCFLLRVLNGCNHICGDTTPEMRAAKKLLLERSLATKHEIKKRWQFDGTAWVEHTLDRPERVDVVLLSFSPSITVGVSFETHHFTACYALFGSVVQHVDSLLQMLRRFRSIFIVEVHLGSCSWPQGDTSTFDTKHAAAIETTKRYNNRVELIEPGILKIYQQQDEMMRPQRGKARALRRAMERAVFSSNVFNLVRDVPALDHGVADDCNLPDATIEAMVDAKVLTCQSQLADASPKERNKFNLLNRLFLNCNLPEALSRDTQRFILRNKETFRFLAFALLEHKKAAVSHLVLDNLTKQFRSNFQDAQKLLSALGYRDFEHFLMWCSESVASERGRAKADSPRHLDAFCFDEALVENVRNRFALTWDKEGREKPVIKTVRCLMAIISKECPNVWIVPFDDTIQIGRERTIHKCTTKRLPTTDQTFLEKFRTIMRGEEPQSDMQSNDSTESTEPATESALNDKVASQEVFNSDLGMLLTYINYS